MPATLALTLGAPASVRRVHARASPRSTRRPRPANVITTAGDAALTAIERCPGHLANGAFTLPSRCRSRHGPATWTAPVSNEAGDDRVQAAIDANDALRTGSYSKTLTFTLSTTTP